MAAKKKARVAAAEYRFRIDAFTPETIPMSRLAEYMAELATMLGEAKSVHFVRVDPGSTVLVHKVEREAVPKVLSRAKAVGRGEAPRDAATAYKTINRFLREDNGTGTLQEKKRGPKILYFPGREGAEDPYPSVRERGSIDGYVMRVGGTDDTIPVLLESEGRQIAGCYTDKATAKKLAQRLFDPARLFGKGLWKRDADGAWSLSSFKIESFEWLSNDSLSVALGELREVKADWGGDDAYDELAKLRHGKVSDGGR